MAARSNALSSDGVSRPLDLHRHEDPVPFPAVVDDRGAVASDGVAPSSTTSRWSSVERAIERSTGPLRSRLGMDGLVDQAKEGDQRAFEELVRRTYADTYTLAFRLTGDEEDARDVVQETYLRVHKSLSRFRGDAQFTTWLHRVTANCASTLLGRRGRHRHDPLPDDPSIVDESPRHDPALRADVGQLRSQLTDALRALPPKLRAVVVLRDIYDLPHEAIAAELGISESAAKVRLHRARKRLRERLYPLHGDRDNAPGAADTAGENVIALAEVTPLDRSDRQVAP
ncbi:MAG: RNA polymerase sigma factor [Acidimicrobiales bacterium]